MNDTIDATGESPKSLAKPPKILGKTRSMTILIVGTRARSGTEVGGKSFKFPVIQQGAY